MSDRPLDDRFGDFESDDAFDTASPDPLQVAIKIQKLRRATRLSRRVGAHDWDDLADDDQAKLVDVARQLIEWLTRQGGIR